MSVGEPLNPEVVRWGMKVFDLRIHDTWWMTETGAQLICNYPCLTIKPGSMGKPIPGVQAAIVDDQGNELPPYRMGNLAIKKGWPSMMHTIWNNRDNMNLILCQGIGMYQGIQLIWMRMVISGSKEESMMSL